MYGESDGRVIDEERNHDSPSLKKKKNRKKDKTTFGEFSGSKSRDAF